MYKITKRNVQIQYRREPLRWKRWRECLFVY